MSQTSLPQTLMSFHLRPLLESSIVASERKGPFIYYGIGKND
jgi:DNA-binding transcriptional ArsR family regulator